MLTTYERCVCVKNEGKRAYTSRNNGVDSDETMTREKSGGIFATPDAKLGIKVHKYVNVEAGLNYRYYIGSKDKWGLSTDKMNGVGAVVSIVGNIPL